MLKLPQFIAHACGGINSIYYTNSTEALEVAYQNGLRFIEIDILTCSDDEYVLLHDWQQTSEKLFGSTGQKSLSEFKKLSMVGDYSQQSLAEFCLWLRNHPDCYLVTDCKDLTNEAFAQYIIKNFPDLVAQIIIQIYEFAEYEKLRNLGFKQLIFATYRINNNSAEIITYLKDKEFLAVAMSKTRAQQGLAKQVKAKLDLTTIVFTINTLEELQEYQKLAIDSCFTDFLY